MGWPEMLVLPNIDSWDFLLADLVSSERKRTHQLCLQNKPGSWGHRLDFCSCEALRGITVLNALEEEVGLWGCLVCPRSQMV